jgi:hypothetical protein
MKNSGVRSVDKVIASWRADERVARQCAASYRETGQLGSAAQLRSQADCLKRCADEIEEALRSRLVVEYGTAEITPYSLARLKSELEAAQNSVHAMQDRIEGKLERTAPWADPTPLVFSLIFSCLSALCALIDISIGQWLSAAMSLFCITLFIHEALES